MNNNSPVTELLIESFDQLLDNKYINLKYNQMVARELHPHNQISSFATQANKNFEIYL